MHFSLTMLNPTGAISFTFIQQENSAGEYGNLIVGNVEPLYTTDENVNWCSHYKSQFGSFSNTLKIEPQ